MLIPIVRFGSRKTNGVSNLRRSNFTSPGNTEPNALSVPGCVSYLSRVSMPVFAAMPYYLMLVRNLTVGLVGLLSRNLRRKMRSPIMEIIRWE